MFIERLIMQKMALAVAFVSLGFVTALAVAEGGVMGIFSAAVQSWASGQIFLDLVIALGMVLVWLWRDAKSRGKNPLPWVLATVVVGSFAPLVYLWRRDVDQL